MSKRITFSLILIIFVFTNVTVSLSQSATDPNSLNGKMEWFSDAKLGIFIHTGIYSVKGIDESWSFYNHKIPYDSYMDQLNGFTLSDFDPDNWASLIKTSGAGYAVITTKHHDGVATFHTQKNNLSVELATPAGMDIIDTLFRSLREKGIRCGAYYSLIDWSNPEYPGFLRDSSRYRIAEDTIRWQHFLNFMHGQISEIQTQYNPDLWWFDGDWEHSAEEWNAIAIREFLLQENPDLIINGRLQGWGDYETPEQNFPVTRPHYPWWELCMTINDSWGYQPGDTNWKTPFEVINLFADVIAHGGNLLLDIGPRADGTIPEEQQSILKDLGEWNRRNEEAVFNTLSGMPEGHYYGPSTLSKDSTTLYLFLSGDPRKQVMIKGLKNKILEIDEVYSEQVLPWKVVGKISWSPVPGIVFIDVSRVTPDPYLTVLRVKLDGPLELYRGTGGLQ